MRGLHVHALVDGASQQLALPPAAALERDDRQHVRLRRLSADRAERCVSHPLCFGFFSPEALSRHV